MRRSLVWIVSGCVALSSCGESPTEPFRGLEVSTDQRSYAAGGSIVLRVNNSGQADAFFFHCNHRISLVIEKREEGTWSDWTKMDGPQCQAIYPSGIIVLFPGTAYERTLEVEEVGLYRVRLEPGTTSNSIGSNALRSNSFEVE